MSDIENELRRLGDNLRTGSRGSEALPVQQRRRIKLRRALFAAAGAVTAVALVATASYGVSLVRDDRRIAPAEDASSILIRFDRSGGFTGEHHVLTIKRDGSAILESPASRGLVEPIEFVLEPDAMDTLQDAVDEVDWERLDERRTLTNVMVADGYLVEMSHDGYNVIIEPAAEPRSVETLIHLLNGIIEERLNDAVARDPRLTLSETEVRSGDVVELAIRARSHYIWGVLTSLEAKREAGWRRAGYWRTWPGKGPAILEPITTTGGAIEDIGFSGSADFRLKIPQLQPGTYRITKEFNDSAGTGSIEDRRVVAEVLFEVAAEEGPDSDDAGCTEPLGFEPTYLPDRWSRALRAGDGGGGGSPGVIGHFGNDSEPGTPDKAGSGFADLFAGTGPFTQTDTSEIEVLGSPARLGEIHEGYSVEFSYEGCRYTLAGYGLDRRELRRFATGLKSVRATESDQGSEQDFSAIWPEDTSEEAEAACRHDDSELRERPESVVVAFADEVLAWDEVEVINRTGQSQFGKERFVYEVQRMGYRRSSPRIPAVIVDAVEVVEGCWSVGSVSRLPDRRPTGVSVVVEGRNVQVGVDALGATSLRIDVVYGGRRVSETGRVGEQGLGEFRLGFDPDTSAYALVLFYDEDGEIFSAATAKWPAGDFAAG